MWVVLWSYTAILQSYILLIIYINYLGSYLLIDCFGDPYQHITEVCEIQHHPLVDEVKA